MMVAITRICDAFLVLGEDFSTIVNTMGIMPNLEWIDDYKHFVLECTRS
jgi:hypothetical protein